MTNIDDLWCEYYGDEVYALMEYRHERKNYAFKDNDTNIKALKRLGDRAGLPAFVVCYADDFSWYSVIPINQKGEIFMGKHQPYLTENEYREFLYQLRGFNKAI